MSADDEHHISGVPRRRRYPRLTLRTMRGGLVDPADLPAPEVKSDIAQDAEERRALIRELGVHTRVGVDERGQPRVAVWMPQSLARHLAELTEDSVRMNLLDGDVEGAAQGMQYARDLRALTQLGGDLGLEPPKSGGKHN